MCERMEQTSIARETNIDSMDEQLITREDNQAYRDNYRTGDCGMDANHAALTQERCAIEEAVKNKQISPGRAKLQLWLYRSMRIVMTDGRILIGIFLCTDQAANVILGVCSEFTQSGTDERMLGLVMVPGERGIVGGKSAQQMTAWAWRCVAMSWNIFDRFIAIDSHLHGLLNLNCVQLQAAT